MQKSRINAKYLHILPILCKYLWIIINIWHCLFLLSRSETEFSKRFQKLPRKITPDLAGYGKNFAIGSSRQSIPSQNKLTPPPSSKRPKKQTARPHKKIRVTGTSRENSAFCGGKITKNSRSSAQTASETVAPQSRRPIPGLCALSPAGISDASKQNAEKYVQNAAAHQKTASKYPQKRLIEQWRKKQIIISNTILIYTGADAKWSAISTEMSKNKAANSPNHTTIYAKNERKYHRIRKTDHTNQYFHPESVSSAQKYIVATGHRDTKRHRAQQCYPFYPQPIKIKP